MTQPNGWTIAEDAEEQPERGEGEGELAQGHPEDVGDRPDRARDEHLLELALEAQVGAVVQHPVPGEEDREERPADDADREERRVADHAEEEQEAERREEHGGDEQRRAPERQEAVEVAQPGHRVQLAPDRHAVSSSIPLPTSSRNASSSVTGPTLISTPRASARSVSSRTEERPVRSTSRFGRRRPGRTAGAPPR